MYILTRSGYKCLPCHSANKTINKYLIADMPDIEDMPPVDGKYRSGVIAASETMAKLLVDKYYEATPGFEDQEN